jgi:hypothetical protein
MSTERYELTRSIIHKCPALKLPQTFLQKLGMTAQIVPLLGLTDEQAQAIVDRLNASGVKCPHGGRRLHGAVAVAENQRKTRDVELILHFLTPQQMAEEIVRVDAQLAACDSARESLQKEVWRLRGKCNAVCKSWTAPGGQCPFHPPERTAGTGIPQPGLDEMCAMPDREVLAAQIVNALEVEDPPTPQLPPLTEPMYWAVRGLEFTVSGEAFTLRDEDLDLIWDAINTALRVQGGASK